MKLKKIVVNIIIVLAIGIIAGFSYSIIDRLSIGNVTSQNVNQDWQANLPDKSDPGNLDFTYAAERTVHGVVHVKTIREREIRQVRDPFGLTSSVTAGIISAKERTLGVLREGEMPLESFLQTDAVYAFSL